MEPRAEKKTEKQPDPFTYLNDKLLKPLKEDSPEVHFDLKDQTPEGEMKQIDHLYIAMSLDAEGEYFKTPEACYAYYFPYFKMIKKDIDAVRRGINIISLSPCLISDANKLIFNVLQYVYFSQKIKKSFLKNKIPCEMDYFYYEDAFNLLEDGETFARLCQRTNGTQDYPERYQNIAFGIPVHNSYEVHHSYAIVHRAAAKHPGQNVVVEFWSYNNWGIRNLYLAYPALIPPNVTVKIRYGYE